MDQSDEWPTLRPSKQELITAALAALRHTPGITYSSANSNVHIQIHSLCGNHHIDYWPTTDKWMVRGSKQKCYTLPLLLKKLAEWGD